MLDDRCAADVVEEIVMSNALFECLCMQINFLTPKGTKMKLLIKNVNSNDNQKIGLTKMVENMFMLSYECLCT